MSDGRWSASDGGTDRADSDDGRDDRGDEVGSDRGDEVGSDRSDEVGSDRSDEVGSDPGDDGREGTDRSGGRGRRDVVVPMRLYKTVTVFSTLIAVFAVVFGFVLLDAATLEISLLRSAVVAGLAAVGVTPDPDVLGAALAVLGLAAIGCGAGVYTLGTRFRARGMGNAQEDANEGSTDG